jgi:hypothetical protein
MPEIRLPDEASAIGASQHEGHFSQFPKRVKRFLLRCTKWLIYLLNKGLYVESRVSVWLRENPHAPLQDKDYRTIPMLRSGVYEPA